MYGADTWALRKREQQIDRTELRMLRWMLGISVRDRKRKEVRTEASTVRIKSDKKKIRRLGHILRDEDSI